MPPSLPAEFTIARSLQAPRPLLNLPSSFRSWLICHLLQEALPDSPLRRASRQPDSLSLDQVSHQRPRPEPMALISLLPGHLSWLQTCPTEPGAPCRQGPLCRRAWHRERAFGKWDWLKVSWLCTAGPAPHRQQTALTPSHFCPCPCPDTLPTLMTPAPLGAGSCPPTPARGAQPAGVSGSLYNAPAPTRARPGEHTRSLSTLQPWAAGAGLLPCLPPGGGGRRWSLGSAGPGVPSRAPSWARRSAGHGLSLPQWAAGGTRGHRLRAEARFRLTVLPQLALGPLVAL